jgi:hypothetical protein
MIEPCPLTCEGCDHCKRLSAQVSAARALNAELKVRLEAQEIYDKAIEARLVEAVELLQEAVDGWLESSDENVWQAKTEALIARAEKEGQ